MKKTKASDDGMYTVQRILDKRPSQSIAGKFEYLIKWVGWSLSQSTWQPQANLSTVNEMVREFNKKLQIQKKIKSSNPPKKIQPSSSSSQNNRKTQTPQKNGIKNHKSSSNKSQNSQSVELQIEKITYLKQASFYEPLEITKQQQLNCNQIGYSQNLSNSSKTSSRIQMQNQDPLIQILTIFNPYSLGQQSQNDENMYRNIRSFQFVVLYKGQEEIMSRDQIFKMDPRALTRYYELCLGLRTGNSGANGSLKRRN